ncbi:calcium-binding protein [Sphingomonas sp. Leaf412]|uniref:hypothetical protein n=1 Tax=Sphingomonas sp. Leaf412 TaxID=1736370 RepID=UPI0006F3CA63|nr:hypothetical protein [Sphingomonas sp. Leaf412]KQT31955.1 calcium-binding protein [Sphingomonas sp. Leaf412]
MILPLLLAAAVPQEAPPIIVSGPLPATPQTPATMVVEPVAMLIATFDADDDAMVDRSELLSGVKTSFEAIDTGKTGTMRYIAFSDWALRYLGDRAALPSPYEVDRDQDDKVTLNEMQDHFSRLFARYDRDGDKLISRAELVTYRTGPIGANGPTQGPKPGEKPSQPPRGRPPRR